MVLDAPDSLQVVSLEDAKVSKKDRVVVRPLFYGNLLRLPRRCRVPKRSCRFCSLWCRSGWDGALSSTPSISLDGAVTFPLAGTGKVLFVHRSTRSFA